MICDSIQDRIVIDTSALVKVFKKSHTKKASGLDSISALLLKTFADELTPVWSHLFQLSVDTGTIPTIWNKKKIIPVPKKHCPQENNDFSPVALTSIVMKRIMVEKLRSKYNIC